MDNEKIKQMQKIVAVMDERVKIFECGSFFVNTTGDKNIWPNWINRLKFSTRNFLTDVKFLVKAAETGVRVTHQRYNGLLFDHINGQVIGTDGHRIHRRPIELQECEHFSTPFSSHIEIPLSTIKMLIRLLTFEVKELDDKADTFFNVLTYGSHVKLTGWNWEIISSVIPDAGREYPLDAITETFSMDRLKAIIQVEARELVRALQKMSHETIELEYVGKGMLSICRRDPKAKSEEIKVFDTDAEGFRVGISSRYMLDAIPKGLKKGEKILIGVESADEPIQIGHDAVVLPVRI